MKTLITIALLTLASLAAWVWMSRNRARKFAEERAREGQRLAAERRLAHEKTTAEAKARDDTRLQAAAEERSQKEAEAREKKRQAEEQRLGAERRAAQDDAKRLAEGRALAEAQARETLRLKAEAEANQHAEADAHEKARLTAEEEQRDEERRRAENHARAEPEAREGVRIGAEEAARRQAEEKVEKERTTSEPLTEVPSSKPPEANETPRPPTYRPTAPPAPTLPSGQRRSSGSPTQTSYADLRLRVQLVFGRGGVVKNLALAPDRRDGMPSEIQVTGTQGELQLTELRDDCYEPVTLSDAGKALLQGIEWRGRGDARRWRWVLGGRELYVLAPGDEFGLHGFVSTARLWLNARHVVLATKRLREEVMAALSQAGCTTSEVSDETVSGVPVGWLVFRDVMPQRAVPMRDERDILNALCPAHEIQPHFVGGVRLERNTWLAGYPPHIRFTGEFAIGVEVKIDGQLARQVSDGSFEAPGWDSEGDHRLWFGDQAETYSLCKMEEGWSYWHAHDFGTGVAICGASTSQRDNAERVQVLVPVTNPLLIGARPGEISCCHERSDIRCETLLAMVPFVPVWALPVAPAHANKQSTRISYFIRASHSITLECRPETERRIENLLHGLPPFATLAAKVFASSKRTSKRKLSGSAIG